MWEDYWRYLVDEYARFGEKASQAADKYERELSRAIVLDALYFILLFIIVIAVICKMMG